MAASKAKTRDNHSWKPIIEIFKSARLPIWLIVINCVFSLAYAQLMIIFPDYTQQVYDGNFEMKIAVLAVAVILGEALLTALMQFVGETTVAKVKFSLREYLWSKLMRLPMEYYEKNEPKGFISRLTTDMKSISEFLAYSVSGAVSTIYAFIGAFVMLFGYDYRLAVSQIIILPICYLIGIIGGRVYFHFQNRIQGELADLTHYVAGVLSNLSLVKLFGQEKREQKNGYYWINEYFKRNMEYTYAASAVEFANSIVQIVQTLTVILFGVYLIRKGSITLDIWIAFYLYADMIFSRFNAMMEIWKTFKQSQGALSRVSDAVSEAPESNEGKLMTPENPEIRFEQVSFGYGEKQVLHQVSFAIRPNCINAIVGPSGSGKSTILLLMDQLYRSYEGKIFMGEHEAKEYDLKSWRSSFCFVEQDTPLFCGSIRDNILYGVHRSVSEEELIKASKRAGAYEFISQLAEGFDTPMTNGGGDFSGGQRQRLALCRAMLTDSPIILLDESLANLDSVLAKSVYEELKALTASKTIVFVTHAMELAKQADQIIVIKQGCVQEECYE